MAYQGGAAFAGIAWGAPIIGAAAEHLPALAPGLHWVLQADTENCTLTLSVHDYPLFISGLASESFNYTADTAGACLFADPQSYSNFQIEYQPRIHDATGTHFSGNWQTLWSAPDLTGLTPRTMEAEEGVANYRFRVPRERRVLRLAA
jgi:hypothetical protein